MIEFIKHALGICGEPWHPNIFTFILSGLGFTPVLAYIKYKYKTYNNNED